MRGLLFNSVINVILRDACRFQYKKQDPFFALLREFIKMRLNRTLSVLAGLVAGLSLSASVSAASTSGTTFKTTIAITASCSMGTGTNTDMSFGSFASTDTAASTQATPGGFSVKCTNLLPYRIGLQPANGNLLGAGVMTGAVNTTKTIAYQLYSDASWATVWGNTDPTNTATKTANGTDQSFLVYGKLTGGTLASQNLPVDNYSDTVAITIYY